LSKTKNKTRLQRLFLEPRSNRWFPVKLLSCVSFKIAIFTFPWTISRFFHSFRELVELQS
jgi:hypothetical protein